MDKLKPGVRNWAVRAKLAGYPLCPECLEPINLTDQQTGIAVHPWCATKIGRSEGRPPLDADGEWRA